ncbi:S8 family serine peptidase [Chryseobacterium sp. BIGb0232]|uniref:S8 family serine peptidase n=1 Tax=Chryseobacterium sp. BIGb0232 TaxID=2940598 RepID=UPI000F466068|nr:S8 family serine peptidase [Chryseobacterium sp. BIGb0232]MCS4301423.1 subtilisin family serine protease [Chryseobacterium sp. BIGb0232]ROS19720.1 peptidase inhibitor I9 [Chryseobacterium nakagawai]
MKRKNKISLLLLAAAITVSCNSERLSDTPESNPDANAAVNSDATASGDAKPIPGQYVVVLNDGVLEKNGFTVSKGTNNSRDSYLRQTGVLLDKLKNSDGLKLGIDNQKISNAFGYALEGFVAKNLTDAEVETLKKDSRIKSVEQDYQVSLGTSTRAVTQAASSQETPWGITRIGGAGDGTGKTAWVIDSGIDLDHPDLNVDTQRSVSFAGDNNPDDGNGHGTHVAGTIAALNNNIGVVGVAAGAKVVALKVLKNNGLGDFSWTVSALDYVYANASVNDVVNMSLGPANGRLRLSTTDQAVLKVAEKGIKIAIAAGNSYDDANYYSPAAVNHANIYTISAVAQGDYWASFSNYGTCVDYAAPGYQVKSTWLNGGYNTISGTSMASPHAAGVLLLGTPKADGSVKSAYWEYKYGFLTNGTFGKYYTGKYGPTNTYVLADYRSDKDGVIDNIIHR